MYAELINELPSLDSSNSLFKFGEQGDSGELLYFLLSRIRYLDTTLRTNLQTVMNPVQFYFEGSIIKIIQCVQ